MTFALLADRLKKLVRFGVLRKISLSGSAQAL